MGSCGRCDKNQKLSIERRNIQSHLQGMKVRLRYYVQHLLQRSNNTRAYFKKG